MSKPNWDNRTVFHGDNLEVLRGMNSESVDLIATDPPFKKGRDFHATPDSLAAGAHFKDRWTWDNDVQQEWVDKIADDWPAIKELVESADACYGEDMAAFLVWMGIRLLEMRRVLTPTGVLYLHCDRTASHYLKMLLDAIFGYKNFRNQIVWHYDGPQRPSDRDFATKHDIILRYAKSPKFSVSKDDLNAVSRLSEEELSDAYQQDENGNWYYDLPRGDYTDESIKRLDREGLIRWTRTGNPRVKKILPIIEGVVCRIKRRHDVWSDIRSLGQVNKKEKTGFKTQKPLDLYERIILTAPRGSVVLDPFCGCATTCVAAERLGYHWAGIDIWEKAHEVVLDRLRQEELSVDGDAGGRLFAYGDVTYRTDVPARTDDAQIAAPKMKRRKHWFEDPPDGHTNAQRKEILVERLTEDGLVYCQGCDRGFDSPAYLQLDHNTPRSDGGSNNISNRRLLCGPCNLKKSNTLTLSGLRKQNEKDGFMVDKGLSFREVAERQKRLEWLRQEQ